ncbi:Fumonisin biosynthetic transcription factor [Lasiodiplodia theobromae]|uniref:Fumonisin biosynthetic transcription factor n=1 Tax=Lasiodiplodia theobromae TaxID=45133 RepID=UPI0015C3DA2E|nr:Fumonisin biosynthetic transcription factor [Lasiodiplodia theobromae]KAF4545509.1 Fumonisin biosynthetic transcription factor [Lasiodiplodia theobromae]
MAPPMAEYATGKKRIVETWGSLKLLLSLDGEGLAKVADRKRSDVTEDDHVATVTFVNPTKSIRKGISDTRNSGMDPSANIFPYEIPVGHITPYSFESASTPVLDKLLEQLSSSDNTAPFEDFEFPYGPTPTPTQNDVQDSAAGTVMGDETVFGNYENHFPGLETLIWNAHQNNLIQDWAAWTPSSSESRRGSSSSQSIFGPLLARIVAEENEDGEVYTGPKRPAATISLQQAHVRSRRQRVVVERVENLLSPENELCVSSLLSDDGPSRDYHSLDLTSLPTERLIQTTFCEPGGLNTFLKGAFVRNIQATLNSSSKPSIRVEDISLLITTLAWGALLDHNIEDRTRTTLIDLACDASKALCAQKDTIRKFLALVAALCLVEKTGSRIMYNLLVNSASTAAALGLHLEPIILNRCGGDEEVVEVQRTMWMLYCIEKSFALRVQTFSILGDDFLPTAIIPKCRATETTTPIPSADWLEIRSKYARICSNILQLRGSLKGNATMDSSGATLALSAALKEWYASTDTGPVISSAPDEAGVRIRRQMFNHYHEALLHLGSLSLSLDSCLSAGCEQSKTLRRESLREVITSSNTISSDSFLQDVNHTYVTKLALCLLAIDIVQGSDSGCSKEDHALLSVASGFFARKQILLPRNDLYRYLYPYQAEVLSSDASYAQQCYPDETSARCEHGNQYRTQNGQINTTWGTWTPIPSLMMPDADVTLTFLSPNWILFAEEVDDPLYSAHRHIAKLGADTGEGSGATIDAIMADEPASPLVCIAQQQYCNPNLDGGARCAPMASSLDSFRLGEALWPDEQQKRIYRWIWLLVDSSADIAASGFQGPLAADQWQQDLEYQHNVSLSNLQSMAVLFADGPSDPDVLRYRQPPRNAQERRLCRSQKVFSRAYLHFSILGLSLTLAIGSAIIVLSYVLEPVVSYFQRRRNLDPYARLEWASNETLQLQRLAHEELGVGSWRRCLEAVPTTGRGEMLAVLDVGDLEHPRLRAVGPGLEVVIAMESEEGRSLVNREDEKEDDEVAVEGIGTEDEDIIPLEIDERRVHKTNSSYRHHQLDAVGESRVSLL